MRDGEWGVDEGVTRLIGDACESKEINKRSVDGGITQCLCGYSAGHTLQILGFRCVFDGREKALPDGAAHGNWSRASGKSKTDLQDA